MDRNVLFSISTTSAALSLVINSLFIYISCKKERKNIGTYRYFLVAFATCNILYSSVEYIAKPVNFIYGHAMLSFNNGPITFVPALDPLFMALFFSMQGIESALLTLHFLYRYIVVCKPEKKKYFEGSKLAIWAAFNLIWGLIYFFIASYCLEPTKECYEYAEKAVRDTFHRDLHELPHICFLAYEIIDNSLIIYWKPTTGIALVVLMTITTIITMIYLGVRTSRTLKQSASSKKTITLQRQMLIALTIQNDYETRECNVYNNGNEDSQSSQLAFDNNIS
ncbi:unnamed protein product [Cylicocyclus nassatus]|uniref:Uncharacterized protein n=1 Tax=Cylicocyclus nassatus TaxID=53992 RepID=A0AA36H5F0_CYLNA|nr:unnamed protein product [Cylicocyclus nassatus]